MQRSRSLSATSAALALALASAGCSDDPCGPGGAPATGLLATGDGVSLGYGALTGGANNDCPTADAPAGVISLTIQGSQTDGTGAFTLCIGRPDQLAGAAGALGPDQAGSAVRVVDVTGTAAGCTYALDRGQAITGTASAGGLCDGGKSPAGFALTVDGTVGLTRTCGATATPVQVHLHGRVAVAAR